MQVIGIDGWKKNWIGIVLDASGFSKAELFTSLDSVIANTQYEVITIDVPIGLPDTPPRIADTIVRTQIGGRRSSVFPSPPAFCLDPSWQKYSEANQESRRRFQCGITAQTFALMNNIRSAERVARNDNRVFEVHPEFSFFHMNNERPLGFSKKSWNGSAERLAILRTHGIHLPERFCNDVGRVGLDDILDAACAAWTALRIHENRAIVVPTGSERIGGIWA